MIAAGEQKSSKSKWSGREAKSPEPGGQALRKIREAVQKKSPGQALEGLRELTSLHEEAVQEQIDLMSQADKLDDTRGKARLGAISARIEVLKDRFLEAGECLKEGEVDPAAIDALLREHRERLGRLTAIGELQREGRLLR